MATATADPQALHMTQACALLELETRFYGHITGAGRWIP